MKTKCPYCNYVSTEHKHLTQEIKPGVGDISFCMNCGEVNEFTKEGLVTVNVEDLDEDLRQDIKDIEGSWLQTRHLRKVKK